MNMGMLNFFLKHFSDVKYSTGKKASCNSYKACDLFDCMDD